MKVLFAFALLPAAALPFTYQSSWIISFQSSATARTASTALRIPVATRGHQQQIVVTQCRTRRRGTPCPAGLGPLAAARGGLGLLTFDLDDSLYPIEPVMDEANAAFCRAMDKFGFSDTIIQPKSIAETCQRIRQELPPAESVALTHTQVRRMAIRREMENVIYKRKLQETADDWATPQSDMSPIVRNFAKKYVVVRVVECVTG
jgi:hypothetical protein